MKGRLAKTGQIIEGLAILLWSAYFGFFGVIGLFSEYIGWPQPAYLIDYNPFLNVVIAYLLTRIEPKFNKKTGATGENQE